MGLRKGAPCSGQSCWCICRVLAARLLVALLLDPAIWEICADKLFKDDAMYIELKENRSFTAELSGRTITDLVIDSEWNGMTKFVHPASGLHLIVMRDVGMVVTGSDSLINDLLAPTASSGYIHFPRTTLPGGLVVEAFEVAQYMNCVGEDGKAFVSESAAPRVRISFNDAVKACEAAGAGLIRGSQHLALAWDIANQDDNWTGGKVGKGHIYRGIHKGNVSSAQRNDFVPHDSLERRWHVLSTGDRIYDFAGHLFSWMKNDLPGNADGLAGKIPADSPYLSVGAEFKQSQGAGWRPDGSRDWSGYALVRGGFWNSGDYAGVFRLYYGSPDYENDDVGFRSTK